MRPSEQDLLSITHSMFKTKGDYASVVVTLTLWNFLHLVELIDSFKKQCKIHLFIIYIYGIFVSILLALHVHCTTWLFI